MYKIDKDVPMPASRRGEVSKPPIPFELLAEAGESFFVPAADVVMANVKMAASRYGKRNQVILSVYYEKNGCRVFRR